MSVHCQLAANLYAYKVMDRGFFAARAVQAALGGLLTILLFRIVPMPVQTFSPLTDARITLFSDSVVASVALLMMCAMLLLVTASKEPGRIKISLEKDRKL